MAIPDDLSSFSHLTQYCFVNAPYARLQQGDLLDLFLTNRLQPEIGLEGDCLWNEPSSKFKHLAAQLADCGLACTLHAPFHDLTPGGFDRKILEITREKLRRAFALLPVFKPRSIVCHLGYEAYKHGGNLNRWLDVAFETWIELLPLAAAENVQVMFENTYEPDPGIHRALFSLLEEFSPRFCLDTGHVLSFSTTPWQRWIQELSPWLGQLHLHDNDGTSDAHLALGHGIFDFTGLLELLAQEEKTLLCTLEQRSREDVHTSLRFLDRVNTTSILP